MAVGATIDLAPTHYKVAGLQVMQGNATVTGDATGGLATLTVSIPRSLTDLFIPIDIYLTGEAAAVHTVLIAGYYERTRGSVWLTKRQDFTLDASGRPAVGEIYHWVKANPWLPYHRANFAAGVPNVQLTATNTDTVGYNLAITALRVPEELFKVPQSFAGFAGGILLR